MGNSTVSLQTIADLIKSQGPLSASNAAGGFSSLTWLQAANFTMSDMVAMPFNFKWNSLDAESFYTNSFQTDYPTVDQQGISWLENGTWIDINNTALPKPEWTIETVRDLQPTSFAASPPTKLCAKYNRLLKHSTWPGAGVTYTNPVGVVYTPSNPRTSIRDANNNILLVTTYGVTGSTAPSAPANSAAGTNVTDGSVVWTVCNPFAWGYRMTPMQPQQGVVYKIEPVAQAPSVKFLSMDQMIDPVTDDDSTTFIAGMYAYAHKFSTDPDLKKEFPVQHALWKETLSDLTKKSDRETDTAGFVPTRSVMASGDCGDIGPANPYGNGWPGWSGR